MAYNSPADLEEERRLMYVAATRAKDRLILCYPGQESMPSWQMAGTGFRGGLSSFIRDLPSGIVSYESDSHHSGPGLKWKGLNPAHKRTRKDVNNEALYATPSDHTGFSQGQRVRHPAFGTGVVSKFVSNDKIEIVFRDAGRKLLHLDYTTLEKI